MNHVTFFLWTGKHCFVENKILKKYVDQLVSMKMTDWVKQWVIMWKYYSLSVAENISFMSIGWKIFSLQSCWSVNNNITRIGLSKQNLMRSFTKKMQYM